MSNVESFVFVRSHCKSVALWCVAARSRVCVCVCNASITHDTHRLIFDETDEYEMKFYTRFFSLCSINSSKWKEEEEKARGWKAWRPKRRQLQRKSLSVYYNWCSFPSYGHQSCASNKCFWRAPMRIQMTVDVFVCRRGTQHAKLSCACEWMEWTARRRIQKRMQMKGDDLE